MCQVLDRMNVSPLVRLAAWETAIVESGVKALDWGDLDSQGPFQQRPSQGWGTPEQVRDPYYATAKFVRGAETLEHRYLRRGRAGPEGPALRPPRALRPAGRAGGGAQRQVLRQMRRGLACTFAACLALAGCGGGSEEEQRAAAPVSGAGIELPPDATPQPLDYVGRAEPALAGGATGVVDLGNRAAVQPQMMDVNREQRLEELELDGLGRAADDGPRRGLDARSASPTARPGTRATTRATIVLSAPRSCDGARFYTRPR